MHPPLRGDGGKFISTSVKSPAHRINTRLLTHIVVVISFLSNTLTAIAVASFAIPYVSDIMMPCRYGELIDNIKQDAYMYMLPVS